MRIGPGTGSPSRWICPENDRWSAPISALPTARNESPAARSRSAIRADSRVTAPLNRARSGPSASVTEAAATSTSSRSGSTEPANSALTTSPPASSAAPGSAGSAAPGSAAPAGCSHRYRTPAFTSRMLALPANAGRAPSVSDPAAVVRPSGESGRTAARSSCSDGAPAPAAAAFPMRETLPVTPPTASGPIPSTPSRSVSRDAGRSASTSAAALTGRPSRSKSAAASRPAARPVARSIDPSNRTEPSAACRTRGATFAAAASPRTVTSPSTGTPSSSVSGAGGEETRIVAA